MAYNFDVQLMDNWSTWMRVLCSTRNIMCHDIPSTLPSSVSYVLQTLLLLLRLLHGGKQCQEVVDVWVSFECLACRRRMKLRLGALAVHSAMPFRALHVMAEIP